VLKQEPNFYKSQSRILNNERKFDSVILSKRIFYNLLKNNKN
jgi:hypothetical protein